VARRHTRYRNDRRLRSGSRNTQSNARVDARPHLHRQQCGRRGIRLESEVRQLCSAGQRHRPNQQVRRFHCSRRWIRRRRSDRPGNSIPVGVLRCSCDSGSICYSICYGIRYSIYCSVCYDAGRVRRSCLAIDVIAVHRFRVSGLIPFEAVITDLIPPRRLKSPTTRIHLGFTRSTRSSRILLTARS
jgi:hypothetical protein